RKRRHEALEVNDGDLEGSIPSRAKNATSPGSSGDPTRNLPRNHDLSSNGTPSPVTTSPQLSPSAQTDEWNTRRLGSRSNLQDISFILHPSHESTSPENDRTSQARMSTGSQHGSSCLDGTATALGVTRACIDEMIKLYFDNMVGINLFHEPTFFAKINCIESSAQTHALLAAMLAFASNFYEPSKTSGAYFGSSDTLDGHKHSARFLNLALSYTDEALKDCGDEAPPLCILQAFIIAAHCQLAQGVLGKAWRTLGTCVRLAYELNLHLIDMKDSENPGEADPKTWCDNEEKRRAWWAIWEMDVFATTIRRTPTAVDWSQIETMLPVEDECWFQNQIRPSCYLDVDPISRWRSLRDSGNQSPKAWFIVINSLMKEAQKISSPRGIRLHSQLHNRSLGTMSTQQSGTTEHARQKLESLANAVQCFVLALPAHLRYGSQYLGFDARVPGQLSSIRQLHSSIYNIHVMTQLARLMIHRYSVFSSHSRLAPPKARQSNDSAWKETSPQNRNADNIAIRQYFEAADNILTIVNRSCDDHIQYINPFLSYTIWLASAVQLVHRGFTRPGTSRCLVKSKFDVLHLTYKRCVEFWDIKAAVQQNLKTLEAQLETCQTTSKDTNGQSISGNAASGDGKTATDSGFHYNGASSTPQDGHRELRDLGLKRAPRPLHSRSIGASGTNELQWGSGPAHLPTPPSIGSATLAGEASQIQLPGTSALEGMYFQTHHVDTQTSNADHTQMTSSPPSDPLLQAPSYLFTDFSVAGPEPYADWRDTEPFNDIQDLLSGYSAY
ncbi:hypothetical protein TOPH_02354, partial [Tolypocladium ophioglossoides CBS 100239]